MSTGVIIVIQATSIILITAFFAFYNIRRRRALERELSSYRDKQKNEVDEKRKELEVELIKEQQAKLHEFEVKILQKDEEFRKNKESIDRILEDYKKSKILVIAAELKNQSESASKLYLESQEQQKQELILLQEEIEKARSEISQLQTNQTSILEALRRNAVEEEKFHLHIEEADQIEISELKTVANKYSRIRGVILKAIYDIYYAPEVRKLISRVVGDGKIMGIYRITSLKDGRVYVGKSTDIKGRWTTHFKRAAGIEAETTNMLYPEMRRLGLDNFSFELLEVVTNEKILSEREKYWQDFYQAKTHGFSIK